MTKYDNRHFNMEGESGEDVVLAWTRLRVSNGALEGMNNKIKLLATALLASGPSEITSQPSIIAVLGCPSRRPTFCR
jgi:hypothetical protein